MPQAPDHNSGDQKTPKLVWWAIVAALCCATIWAGQSVAVKETLTGIPPLSMMAFRFLISVPVIIGVALVIGVKLLPKGTERRLLALSGLLLCVQIGLFTVGTGATTSVHSTILINTFPFFTAFFGHFLLVGHRMNLRLFIGIVVAFSSIPLLMWEGLQNTDSGSMIGNLTVLSAAIVMGSKIVLMKKILREIHPVKLAFWDGTAALCLFGIAALVTEGGKPIDLTANVVTGLIYQGFVVSVIGFLLWLYLLSAFSANQLNVFRLFTPPLGVIMGALILDEPVSKLVLLSLLLVCGGLFLVVGINRKPQKVPGT